MGEGAALFVLKRLADAERDGDRIYAVLLGVGGVKRRQGKGITAPNPVGQRLAVERAWHNAGVRPGAATYIEAHGTSTRVGDATELASMTDVFRGRRGHRLDRAGLGEVEHRPPEGRGRAPRACSSTVSPARESASAEPHFERPNPTSTWRLSRCGSTPSFGSGRRAGVARGAPASAPLASAAPTSTPCSRSTCRADTAPPMRAGRSPARASSSDPRR